MDLSDPKTLEQVAVLLVFLAPGLIALFFRSRFVTGRRPKTSEYVGEYVVLSSAYFSLAFPLLGWVISNGEPLWLRVLLWATLLAVLPAVLGLISGIGTQKGWWRKTLGKFGLSVVSPYPTGWDWIFSRLRNPVYLLVTLDDKSVVSGYFGLDSLASSDPAERDIFIEEIYDIDASGRWQRRPEKQGIWISGKSIRHVEIWRAPTSEAADEQQ